MTKLLINTIEIYDTSVFNQIKLFHSYIIIYMAEHAFNLFYFNYKLNNKLFLCLVNK